MAHSFDHIPVLRDEVVSLFAAVPPGVVTLPDSPAGRDKIFLLAGGFELVNSAAAVFHNVKIIPRIHGDTVSLIELAGQVSDLTHARHDLA